jgi:hypothetical protein
MSNADALEKIRSQHLPVPSGYHIFSQIKNQVNTSYQTLHRLLSLAGSSKNIIATVEWRDNRSKQSDRRG